MNAKTEIKNICGNSWAYLWMFMSKNLAMMVLFNANDRK